MAPDTYYAFVALLGGVFLTLMWASRRVAYMLVLNGIAITQLIGCFLMELGFPGYDIQEFGYVNYSSAAMLAALIAVNLIALGMRTRMALPGPRPAAERLDSPFLLTAVVVLVSVAMDAVVIAQGAPLLTGATDEARVGIVHGNGAINYLRGYVLPPLAALAWYKARVHAPRGGLWLRAAVLLCLMFNAALVASKSAMVIHPLGIILIELTLKNQQARPSAFRRLRTFVLSLLASTGAVGYMILMRFLHANGSMSFADAANSIALRAFLGQGNVYWKAFGDAGDFLPIAGRIWANLFNVKYLLPMPREYQFYYAVSLKYTNDYFAEYWNLVATFLGEPVLLFGAWGIALYVPLLAGVIALLQRSLLVAMERDRAYRLAITVFFMFQFVDYWQMGGLYGLLSLKSWLVCIVLVVLVKAQRLTFSAFRRSPHAPPVVA